MVVIFNRIDLQNSMFTSPIEDIELTHIVRTSAAKHQASVIIFHDQVNGEFKILKDRKGDCGIVTINKYNKGVLLDLLLDHG